MSGKLCASIRFSVEGVRERRGKGRRGKRDKDIERDSKKK